MQNIFPVTLMLLVMLIFCARVIVNLSLWPTTSRWLWPWLRQHPWWPVPADRTAESLLRSSLPTDTYRRLCQTAYLDVPSPSRPQRTYRIPRGAMQQVLVVESGRTIERLCLQPVEALPEADVILLHKLLIEADEDTYLATANHFPRAVWR